MSFEKAINERDRLTGIFSRDYFDQTAREFIDENKDVEFAVLEIDINRLTVINELYGVQEGDNTLKYMATTLEEIFQEVPFALYARIQADLFAVFCPWNKEKVEGYISEIESAFSKYSQMLNIDILISFGVYICDDRKLDVQLMRDRAKLALKTIKGNYIVHMAYYDDKMHDAMIREQDVVQNMTHALENREFVVYFQPKHSLDDGRLVGAEALVRWKSESKGMISPGVFIPIFEDNGFIMKLDRYVWEEACRFIRKRLDLGEDVKPISVNVSRINLYNPELVMILKNLIEKYEIPYDLLELEFTESAYTDNPQLMLQTMAALQELGFKVEMDDFGSGYSSLNMLKDVPVDVLKIDLNFMSKTNNSEKALIILSSIVRMAKWLGINSIVEGVETEEQIEYLKGIGCTTVQGYYYAKPMPEDEYIAYSEDNAKKCSELEIEKSERVIMPVEPNDIWMMIQKTRNDDFPIFDAYGLYEYSKEGIEAIRLSDSYYELFKTTREFEFANPTVSNDRIHEDDWDILVGMFENAATGENYGEGVFRRILDDGTVLYIYAKCRLLGTNESGDSKLVYLGVNDITRFMDKHK